MATKLLSKGTFSSAATSFSRTPECKRLLYRSLSSAAVNLQGLHSHGPPNSGFPNILPVKLSEQAVTSPAINSTSVRSIIQAVSPQTLPSAVAINHAAENFSTAIYETPEVSVSSHQDIGATTMTNPGMSLPGSDIAEEGTDSSPAPDTWDLSNIRPYKDSSALELLNSVLVFEACKIPSLASIAAPIISLSKSIHLSDPVYAVVKRTFFAHFCGGEDINSVTPTMAKFASQNVGTILDLALEADIDAKELSGLEAKQHSEKIKTMFMESVNIAATQADSFLAVKVTAFVPPTILQRWTNTLRIAKTLFEEADSDNNEFISESEFVDVILKLSSVPESQNSALVAQVKKQFESSCTNNNDGMDWIDFSDTLSLGNANARGLLKEIVRNANLSVSAAPVESADWHELNDKLTLEDLKTLDLVLEDLDQVCAYAKDNNVKIMIDAEQTYFQKAVDDIAISLCKKFNPSLDNHGENSVNEKASVPIISNTYQMYLIDSYQRLKMDIRRAERGSYSFGVKLVRGAYMSSERKRAKAYGYPDPINPDIESTHKLYNSAIDHLVSKISRYITSTGHANTGSGYTSFPLSFVVASHNVDSVDRARRSLKGISGQRGNDAKDSQRDEGPPLVGFAQLMGMKDSVSFGMAAQGFKAYKYVPYGPIEVTIPYLLRRAQENSSLLGGEGASQDRKVLSQEVWRRLFG